MQMGAKQTPKSGKFKRGFKKWAEDSSIEYRVKLGLRPSDPLPCDSLAEHLGVSVMVPDNFIGFNVDLLNLLNTNDNWSALSYKINGTPYIVHNKLHVGARRESDVMHELAHLICRHQMGMMEHEDHKLALRKYDEAQEAEAEWLGGCLQLPRIALYFKKVQLGMDIPGIATLFNASEQMVRYRLGVTGLLR